jgi:[lysine-biosynthesis-protein LysW]--L-2-aminoadipate ligase
VVLARFPGRVDLSGAARRFAVVASRLTPTNRQLVEAARRLGASSSLLRPPEAAASLRPGDLALGRLDVLPSLDGVEPGLEALRSLEQRAVDVLNRPGSLLAAHDKLATALRLGLAGLPHPRTAHVGEDGRPDLELPVVVKPRFGSWGRDVTICGSPKALGRCLRRLRHRSWFCRQGALVQELVRPQGHDLRVVVAGGTIVGAVERVAAEGEWRTNVALGARRRTVEPPPGACLLALGAAQAVGADLAGVDLLPDGSGGYVVLEVNGAVDFNEEYSLDGEDVFERAVGALLLGRYARGDEEEAEADEALSLSAGAWA